MGPGKRVEVKALGSYISPTYVILMKEAGHAIAKVMLDRLFLLNLFPD